MQENRFDQALRIFVEGCARIRTTYYQSYFPKENAGEFKTLDGRKYVKLVINGSAFCFVNKENGDVLMAASWKSPAKHARGNIFDTFNGLQYVGPYGMQYLR